MSKQRGFTLIELVVVIAIIAILAAIALPSYTSYIRKGRRSAAEGSLQQIALKEERFRADNPTYSGTWTDVGGDPTDQYYKYTLAPLAGPPATYTATATALGNQANDKAQGTSCTPLTYDFGVTTAGVITKLPAGCW